MKTITTQEIMSLYKKANANPNQKAVRQSINIGTLTNKLANHSINSHAMLNRGSASFRQR